MESRSTLPGAGWVAVQYLFSVLNLALGCLIMLRRPYGVVPRLLALAFIGTAATFNEASHVVFHLLEHAPLVSAVHFTFHIVSGVAYAWAVVLFPGDGDGYRLPGPGSRHRALGCGRAGRYGPGGLDLLAQQLHLPPAVLRGLLRDRDPGPRDHGTDRSGCPSGTATRSSQQQSKLLRMALFPALAAALLWLTAHAVDSLGLVSGAERAQSSPMSCRRCSLPCSP